MSQYTAVKNGLVSSFCLSFAHGDIHGLRAYFSMSPFNVHSNRVNRPLTSRRATLVVSSTLRSTEPSFVLDFARHRDPSLR